MTNKNQLPKGPLISAKELAKITLVDEKDIKAYCEIFDKDSDDDWALNEDEHFVWVNKKFKVRQFTKRGALEIAKYVEKNVDSQSL